MAEIKLITYTPNALELLLRTKNTRLTFESDPSEWTMEEKLEHLSYMKDTIKSSWEFVDYVFEIEGVTRAFTHQFVRTRTGSYAQQAMRVVDARKQHVLKPDTILGENHVIWDMGAQAIKDCYGHLLDNGVSPQDARGILPTNITTSIMAKFNLRTLHDMALLRLCTRTQGEYQDVFRAMREEVIKVHPWVEGWIQPHCVQLGVCAFPRYGKEECPAYLPGMDQTAIKEAAKETFWSANRYEASPIANKGKAQ